VAADQRSWSAVPPTDRPSAPRSSPEASPEASPEPSPEAGPDVAPEATHSTEVIDLTIPGTPPDDVAPTVDLDDRRPRLIVAGLTEVPARTDTPS
jgi:hypothetical protein